MMKVKFLLFCSIVFLSVSAFSQTDGEIPTTQIPVEEKKDAKKENTTSDSPFNKPIELPDFKPEKGNEEKLDLPVTGSAKKLDYKREKGFNMTEKSTLIDPAVIFEKRWKDKGKQIALELGEKGDFYKNKDLGSFDTESSKVVVGLSDFGVVDGDLINIYHNDELIRPRVYLQGAMKGFEIELVPGINKIDFEAINQGSEGYNTAAVVVFDQTGTKITSNAWHIATNFFATIIVTRQVKSSLETQNDN